MSSVTLAPFQVLRSHVARGFPSGQCRLQTTSIITDHSSGQHWVQALLGLCPRVPRSPEEKVRFLRLAAFEETAVRWPEGQRRSTALLKVLHRSGWPRAEAPRQPHGPS